MSNDPTTSNQLMSLWDRLTAPHPVLQKLEEKRQAQLLACLALVLVPLGLLGTVLTSMVATRSVQSSGHNPFPEVVSTLLGIPIYALSRTPYYKIGAKLAIGLSTISILVVAFLGGKTDLYVLSFLIIPVILSCLFFSLRSAGLFLAFSIILLLSVPLALPQISFMQIMDGPLQLVLILSAILIIANAYIAQLQKDRQKEIEYNEQRYRILSELMSDYAYSLSVSPQNTTQIEWVGGAYNQITGYDAEERIAKNLPNVLHPDDKATFDAALKLILSGQVGVLEYRIIDRQGDIRWLRNHARPVWDEKEGRVVRIYGAAKDITAQKEIEAAEYRQRTLAEALRDTATMLNSTLDLNEVLDHILENITKVVPNDDCSIIMLEDGVGRIVRHHGVTAIEEALAARFPLESTATLRTMYQTGQPLLIEDVAAFPGWIYNANETLTRSFLGTPIRISGEVAGFLTIGSSLLKGFSSEQISRLQAFADQASIAIRNAQIYEALYHQAVDLEQRVVKHTVELDRERKQLQAILDSMGEGMFYTDGAIIQYVNRFLCQITGYTPQELVGQSAAIFRVPNRPDNDVRLYDLNSRLKTEPIWRGEVQLLAKDRRILDAALSVSLVSDPAEEPMRAVTVVRDISAEKALNLRKSRFIAIASHELRTPITNLNTRLYLIRRQPGKIEEHLQIIEEVVNRMHRLVEDLLDIARFEHGAVGLRLAVVDLRDLIGQVVRLQEAESTLKNIALIVDMPSEPLPIALDPNRIAQAITNLIVNAINYTPQGGSITVKLVSESNADYAVVSITDSGIGIAPEYIQHVFEPFFRIEDAVKGTGLGLSITKEIVTLHGGDILVESEPGKGSCFQIRLPVKRQAH
jgi:PAS domain S-box-containing protein